MTVKTREAQALASLALKNKLRATDKKQSHEITVRGGNLFPPRTAVGRLLPKSTTPTHSHVKTKCTCGCALTTLKTFMVFTCTGGSNYLVLTVNLKKLESKIYSVSRQTCIFEANFSKFFPHFISTCRTFGDLKGKSDRDRFIC